MPTSNKIFYGWWVVLACLLISLFLGGIVFYGFTAFFEPLINEFGWSYTQISFALSLRGLEMGIFAPFVGFLVDRFGSRKLIFTGMVAVGLGLLFLSFTESLPMFYGVFLLIAFGAGGCASNVTIAAVGKWFHRKVGIALGIMACGYGAAGLLVPLIIRLIDQYQWRMACVILAFSIWIIGVPLSFVIRDTPEQYGWRPDGELLDDSVIPHGEVDKEFEFGFKKAIRNKSFFYINMAEALRMMVLAAVASHIMPYLDSVGMERQTAGFIAAGIPLFSIIGRFAFGWLADVFDKRHVMALAIFLQGLGMLALSQVKEMSLVFLFLLSFSPGFGGAMVLRGAIVREYFGRKSFGKMIGITMGYAAIGGILGPTLAGWAFDVLESYYIVWLTYCIVLVLASGMILKVR